MPSWMIPAVLAVCALLLFWRTFVNLHKARIIEDVPTSKIRSAHQGYVELVGQTAQYNDEAISAPLTGQPCVWYHYKIERYESGKKSHWTTVEEESSNSSFTLKDETGECTIRPKGSEVTTSTRKQWTGYERHPRKTERASFLRLLTRQRYRYTERRIHANRPLYAIGWFSTHHGPSPAQQEDDLQKQLLHSWKKDYPALLSRFDKDRNGVIDPGEWEQTRAAAAQEAKRTVTARTMPPPMHSLTKPSNGKPWLLSTEDPEGLSKKYRRQSLMHMVSSLAASASAYWFFVQH